MAVVIPPINDGVEAHVSDLLGAYVALVQEARDSVNRALGYPIGSGSRQAESTLANALIQLATLVGSIYNGATPFTLVADPPPPVS